MLFCYGILISSSPTCPSTCSSQTRTCSNGSWNSSFDSSYTASSCTPQSVSCDSSYYPATSTSNNCSSWVDCTEYSVSNKSCVEGSTRYYASQPKAGYYVDHSNSNDDDCYAICNPSSSSCNGGYTPSGNNYSSTYTCTKGSSSSIVGASSTSCSCPSSKVRYNGSCQTVSTTCGSSHYNCIGGNSSANTPISHGYTRTCIGSSTKYCHECNTNYVRDGDSCELDVTCSYNGSTYNIGDTVTVYTSSSPTCPTTCSTTTATCQSNGTWNKTMYSSCTPEGVECNSSTYPLTSASANNAKSYNICTGYTVSSNSCSKYNRWSIKECNSGYSLVNGECVLGSICNTSTNPGGCTLGTASNYSSKTRFTTYSYECTYNGETQTCNATCPNGKIWDGSSCVTKNACSTTKFTCNQGMVLDQNTGSTAYTWKCRDVSHSNVLGECSIDKENFCNTSTNPGSCSKGSASDYSTTPWLSNHTSYYRKCTYNGETQSCSTKCGTNQVYNGSQKKCVTLDACSTTKFTCKQGTVTSKLTGSTAYTWSCYSNDGRNLGDCSSTLSDTDVCGTKPSVLNYYGYGYNYNVQYNGSNYYINHTCTCNTSSKTWSCSKYIGTAGYDTNVDMGYTSNNPSTTCDSQAVNLLSGSINNINATKGCVHICGSGPCNRSCKIVKNCTANNNRWTCGLVTYVNCTAG